MTATGSMIRRLAGLATGTGFLAVSACAHDWEDLRFAPDGVAGSGAAGLTGGSSVGAAAGQGGSTSSGGVGAAAGTGGTGGTTGAGGAATACDWSDPSNLCPADHYCDAVACKDGECRPLGSTQNTELEPVCGCDDVTYWNESVATSHGMPSAHDGPCQTSSAACTSSGSTSCPTGQHCNLEVPVTVGCGGSESPGDCWVLPQDCSDPGLAKSYISCVPPVQCANQCTLISEQVAYILDEATCG